MRAHRTTLLITLLLLGAYVRAQDAKSAPDTLVFINGEQLTGTLVGADAKGITFNSPMAGELTVVWANVKELRSDKQFAVLTAQQKLTRRDAAALVPEGTVTVAGEGKEKQITVATATGPKTVPVGNADRIVDAAAFDRAINRPPGLLGGWGGAANGGVSLVRATQNSTTFNGGVNLVRATPSVDWLPARTRTTLDYNQSYGQTSQSTQATIKTNIFHAQAEQDVYISPRLFVFGSSTFDHNFSESLELQQAYGGGLGITLVKSGKQQLDLKGDVHYERQAFFNAVQNQNLFGSTFSERYLRNLPRKVVFTEFGSVSPSWNNTDAYSAHAEAQLVLALFKNLGFNLGAADDYLNNAPAGSKKNSVQLTTGFSYTIKPR